MRRRVRDLIRRGIQRHRFGMDRVRIDLRKEAVAHQHVEHDALAGFGRIEIGEEIEIGRLLRDARQEGRLGQR